ncbi:hypothetical protein CBS101457_002324 [Exobasidium rhododendri]|nr:hypothetical protein CBS101457_002324 [Exobasidium rhododendri]
MSEDERITLTPEERHQLLKCLVCAQMLDEWALVDEGSGLQQYGPPFTNNGSAISSKVGFQSAQHPEHTTSPLILMHLFQAHLRRFPGVELAKSDYWRHKIAPLFEKISQATFSNCQERSELTNRKILAFVATRYISTFWSRGIGVRGEGELKGPGRGEAGSEEWGVGKKWGKGTVKRGMERPMRPSEREERTIEGLFAGDTDDGLVWKTAGSNVRQLKQDWSAWKESIIESEGGFSKTLDVLEVQNLNNVPVQYRNAAEWVRRHVAFVLWTVFVVYPGGEEILSIIKMIHALTPYWGIKQLLKIANAQKMIKAVIDMMLARPVGMIDSLGQRIFFAVMNGEISFINKSFLVPLRKALREDKICSLLDNYVNSRTSEQRSKTMRVARDRKCDMLIIILEEYNYEDVRRTEEWQEDFLASEFRSNIDWAYPAASMKAKKMRTSPPADVQSESSEGALKFAQLKLYLRERLRRRDREKVLEIGSGPLVPGIIKDSLEIIFYNIIYEIARASDLSARIGDWQKFLDDLIQVKSKKQDDLEDWIALCARHENNAFIFVHEIRHAVEPIFKWCQEALDYMALSTTDPGNPSNRKATNVEINLDEMLMEASMSDDVDVKAIMRELNDIVSYSKWYKIEQEVQMRKEYVNIRADSITNSTRLPKDGRNNIVAPSDGMKKSTQNTSTLMKRLMEQVGIAWDDGILHTDSRGTDVETLPWGYFGTDDILHQHYGTGNGKEKPLQYNVEQRVSPVPPTLSHLRKLLPTFRAHLQRKLPDWPNKAVC